MCSFSSAALSTRDSKVVDDRAFLNKGLFCTHPCVDARSLMLSICVFCWCASACVRAWQRRKRRRREKTQQNVCRSFVSTRREGGPFFFRFDPLFGQTSKSSIHPKQPLFYFIFPPPGRGVRWRPGSFSYILQNITTNHVKPGSDCCCLLCPCIYMRRCVFVRAKVNAYYDVMITFLSSNKTTLNQLRSRGLGLRRNLLT